MHEGPRGNGERGPHHTVRKRRAPEPAGRSRPPRQVSAKLALTAVDYPPMQDPASFNLEAVKKKVEEMIKHREGQ